MAKGEDAHLAMAQVHQSDGSSVIFNQCSPSSYYSRNSYESSPSPSSGSDRGRHRSSSSSNSSSRSRSRSHPRCHRHSHCRSHRRHSRGHRHSARRHRAHSRSYSRSPSLDRYHGHRRRSTSRSHSRSSFAGGRCSKSQARLNKFPKSQSRAYRSPSRTSGSSISLSLEDKRELLKAAKTNAMKLLGVEKLEIPDSVKPILTDELEEPQRLLPVFEPRVRSHPEKTSQSDEAEATIISPKMAAKPKTITFSINNCVARPSIMVPSEPKVTAIEDTYESTNPYGHWVPVVSRQSARPRKQVRKKSR
ncbi:arginine/serine-rich protein 1 [Syngnathus scovelli]|uniref:arginine/serine-rich protein 1 n=1 Tax=Syngnathus scovelli TaxID=161590 RepID=UPI0021105021|nr:arginine/serine-rich protein 1 [Syngnathus scovelli]XP_049595683.1 arginine/serine-rich protein 1 [Syngnathus scovelli]